MNRRAAAPVYGGMRVGVWLVAAVLAGMPNAGGAVAPEERPAAAPGVVAVPWLNYDPRPWYRGYPPYAAPIFVPAPDTPQARFNTGQASSVWYYYCSDSNAYYPQVAACASGWQPVVVLPAR